MRYFQRKEIILNFINKSKYANFNQIENLLELSSSTIRRDLEKLISKDIIKKIDGTYVLKRINNNKHRYDQTTNLDKKRRIAKKASSLIKKNDSIIINGGSTCYYIHEFTNNLNFSVFTNSFVLASTFLEKDNVNVSIGGGSIISSHRLIVSPHEQDVIKHLYASKYFLGAKAITEVGLLESDPQVINSDNELMKKSEKIIVLADSSKFLHKEGCFASISLDSVDIIITDDGINSSDKKLIEKNNIELIIA